MMTRKDYKRAAEIVNTEPKRSDRLFLAMTFVKFFIGDNPRFNAERFVDACNTELDSVVRAAFSGIDMHKKCKMYRKEDPSYVCSCLPKPRALRVVR
jgi:hypothetical protein